MYKAGPTADELMLHSKHTSITRSNMIKYLKLKLLGGIPAVNTEFEPSVKFKIIQVQDFLQQNHKLHSRVVLFVIQCTQKSYVHLSEFLSVHACECVHRWDSLHPGPISALLAKIWNRNLYEVLL